MAERVNKIARAFPKHVPFVTAIFCGVVFAAGNIVGQVRSASKSAVPKTWDDRIMAVLEVPLANPEGSPKQVPAEYYYRIPVRPIYKQYPVYAPGHEPAGYLDWLKTQEPVLLWDDASGKKPVLKTRTDWLKAGEMVFDSPIGTSVDQGFIALADVRNSQWYEKSGMPVTKDGILPFVHYVIREKGKVELGSFSCEMCHTRVMPSGTTIKGAQGNFPFERAGTHSANPPLPPPIAIALNQQLYAVPWLHPDPLEKEKTMSPAQMTALLESIPPGVISRHRASTFTPVQVPDLIGVQDRKYLDRTGLQPQHSIMDLMRYAALNQGGDFLANFDGFIPADVPEFKKLPDPGDPVKVGGRYSDEQLYALAQYVYSLKPPLNPNKFGAEAARGKRVFREEGCAECHKAPLYTNNKLTPADGFKIPADHRNRYDILSRSVHTDTGLTLTTRRGTGYYKVPSLKGVWYRSMFGHSGWCASLEDWFDPKRVEDEYVPTGFKPYGTASYAVKGHAYGLDLSEEEREALIAFLKTL